MVWYQQWWHHTIPSVAYHISRQLTSLSMKFHLLCFLISSTSPFHVVGWSGPRTLRTTQVDIAKPQHESRRRVILATTFLVPLVSTSFPWDAGAKDLDEEYRQGTLALKDMDDQAPVPREAYEKLPSGVIYADLRPGKKVTVREGSKINMQWVLRKSNGYFVDSSAVQGDIPFIFTVGDGTAIKGLDEGIRGIQEGGVRRILMPPSLAYADGLEDGKPGPLPAGYGPRQQMRRVQTVRKDVPGEYIFLEVQVTRVR